VVLAPSWLRMFSPSEINQLISGGQGGGVDVDDMARCAEQRKASQLLQRLVQSACISLSTLHIVIMCDLALCMCMLLSATHAYHS
jgi:hypothetical protein